MTQPTTTQTQAPKATTQAPKASQAKAPRTPKAPQVKVGTHTKLRFRISVNGVTCEGSCPNGHITKGTARECQASAAIGVDPKLIKLLTHPRFWGQVKVTGQPAQICQCRFGHKASETALKCGAKLARTLGLTVTTKAPAKATKAPQAPTKATKGTTQASTKASTTQAPQASTKAPQANPAKLTSGVQGTIAKA